MSDDKLNSPLVRALRSRDQALADQAARLIQQASRLLKFTLSTFSSGTDHSSRHTRSVETIARLVLSDNFLAALAPAELFVVAVVCHYHDVAPVGTAGP